MPNDIQVSDRALALHHDAIIFDGLTSSPNTAAQGERMRRGGLTAANMTAAWVDKGFHAACRDIARVRNDIECQSDSILLGTRASDVQAAKDSGRTAIFIGLQNGKPVEDSLDNLDILYHLGVRIIQLTYNDRNYLADGCTERRDGGLSSFGVAAVERMAELGIVVDLSHCSELTCLDSIDASPRPVIISHANPSALFPNPRNKSDKVIRRLSEQGGVIGACAWSPLLVRDPATRPQISDLVDAIEYMVQLVGIDSVGIGTDLGEGTYVRENWESLYLQRGVHSHVTSHLGEWWGFDARFPPDLESVIYLPRITEALLARGYRDEDVRKLWGQNFLRVFGAVWQE